MTKFENIWGSQREKFWIENGLSPGDYPEENIQHTEHGESFKSRVINYMFDPLFFLAIQHISVYLSKTLWLKRVFHACAGRFGIIFLCSKLEGSNTAATEPHIYCETWRTVAVASVLECNAICKSVKRHKADGCQYLSTAFRQPQISHTSFVDL